MSSPMQTYVIAICKLMAHLIQQYVTALPVTSLPKLHIYLKYMSLNITIGLFS